MMSADAVLITGSSRGLGEQLALVFASNGYDVIIHGRNLSRLEKVKTQIVMTGVECYISAGDIKQNQTIEELYRAALEKDISVFINNAGISLIDDDEERDLTLPLDEVSDKQVEDILVTNLVAPVKLTRRIYSFFKKKGYGAVININSLAGLEPQELKSVYGASKWGLRGFTNAFRKEAVKHGVRVIGVYPSRIRTKRSFTYGMDSTEVARKIYKAYLEADTDDIVLDGRPGK